MDRPALLPRQSDEATIHDPDAAPILGEGKRLVSVSGRGPPQSGRQPEPPGLRSAGHRPQAGGPNGAKRCRFERANENPVACAGRSYGGHNCLTGPRFLYLDHDGSPLDFLQDLRQRGDRFATPGVQLANGGEGHVPNHPGSVRSSLDGRIVNDDRNPVLREANVQL